MNLIQVFFTLLKTFARSLISILNSIMCTQGLVFAAGTDLLNSGRVLII
jgi:hypothetical protein